MSSWWKRKSLFRKQDPDDVTESRPTTYRIYKELPESVLIQGTDEDYHHPLRHINTEGYLHPIRRQNGIVDDTSLKVSNFYSESAGASDIAGLSGVSGNIPGAHRMPTYSQEQPPLQFQQPPVSRDWFTESSTHREPVAFPGRSSAHSNVPGAHRMPTYSQDFYPDSRHNQQDAEYHELGKAMKEGIVDYQGIDSVVVGIGGAGKTHTLAMILKERIPDKRVSTPCTNPPVRTVTQMTISEDCGVLERVDDENYLTIVSDTVREVAHSLPSTSQPLVRICLVPHFMRELEEKMNQCLHHENPEEPVQNRRLLYKLRWNRLTDSGGQPQFLEVLPIFLHHISLGIFVIKLNERLDGFPMIEFYNHAGNSVGAPFMSRYSQEQVIRHFMRALISQCGQKVDVKFLFIGTHRDRMEESKDESIHDKNEKLKKIIISFKMESNVVYNGQDPIFAINAKSPQEEDWKVIGQVRKMLVKSANVPPIQIPIRWFALELALQCFVQKTKQPVLLESKCLELVPNFQFNEANFKAALNYLHQIKHIFYYESGLKRLVVTDMAVIQNKLSEVVSFSINLCTNPSGCIAVGYKWIRFSKCGILHISCLERFPSHYTEEFTSKDLLQLFTSLCIVSKLNSDEYLMPCVLPVEENTFCNPEPETQTVPAMVVEFPDGGPMLGSYCGLVCYLINTGKWAIATKRNGEPFHITRSSIHFLVPPTFDKVTVNDPLSTFFLVTFHGPLDEASQVCPLIRETILTGIREVSKNLNYLGKDKAGSVNTHSNKSVITFLCACETTPLHPANCVGKYLRCPNSSKRIKLTAGHKAWLEGHVTGTVDLPAGSEEHRGLTLVKDVDVGFLMNILYLHSYKWDVIGTALCLLPGELENIRHSPQVITPQQRLNEVLCQWVQWPTEAHSQVPTMETLCDALRSDIVGLGAVANQVCDIKNHLPSQHPTSSHAAMASGRPEETCEELPASLEHTQLREETAKGLRSRDQPNAWKGCCTLL